MKQDMKVIVVNTKSREIFVRICYVRQKESTLATWMLKMYPIIKRSGEL